MTGQVPIPKWLAVYGLLSRFGVDREKARRSYQQFVADGVGRGIWDGLRRQIYLGSEAFVERMQAKAMIDGDALTVPQTQRRAPAPTLTHIAVRHQGRNAATVAAYATGAYRYREIVECFGVHLATVGRIVRAETQRCENCPLLFTSLSLAPVMAIVSLDNVYNLETK